MWRISEWLPLLTVVISLTLCHGQSQPKIVNTGGNTTNPRLGLVASQLGLSPVPGSSYGGGPIPQENLPSQDYLPTGGAPEPYTSGNGGAPVGNVVDPVNQCQCVPVEYCPSYHGGGSTGGSYGGQSGGNVPPPGGNPPYDAGPSGGNVPVVGGGGGGSYGGQGSNIPVIGKPGVGDSYGGQGGNLPIIGQDGQQGGSYGGQGGIIPVVGQPGGGDSYGGQGGNIPVISQGPGGTYAAGEDGVHGGNLPVTGDGVIDQGYSRPPGEGDAPPNTDGAGLLDLRIVNRPPRPGGVQCLDGQVFCCDAVKPGQESVSKPNYPGPGGSGGYVTCGSRNYIDVPDKKLEYGDAKFGAYPWMAVILGKSNNYVGAGALISPYFVLTAAHKIKSWKPGTPFKARFGEWNAKEDDEPYKNVEVPIADVTFHPGFNPDNLQNDLALVRLAKPIDTKGSYPHIKSVCLPQKGYQYAGQRCWVAGFGKDAFGSGKHSYIMKEVDLPVVDSDICEQRLRTTRLGKQFQLNRYSFLCAGGEEGKDACTGDGGSPLVCDTGKEWQVAGLVAWGIGCADYGIPGVYVNVPNYVDWINEEIYKY